MRLTVVSLQYTFFFYLLFLSLATGGTYTAGRLRSKVMQTVKDTLRPEFFNRIDEFVIFDSLTKPRKSFDKLRRSRVQEFGVYLPLRVSLAESALSLALLRHPASG